MKEALYSMANDFVQSIKNKKEPLSHSGIGLEVIRILEASQTSIKNKGQEVKL
jgi:hypothetical protein